MNRPSACSILITLSGVAALFGAAGACADERALAVSQCTQCHTLDKGEPHGQGPSLWGLIGRSAGSAPGYRYSEGFMIALKGKIWDAALLDRWLTDTLAVAPGSQMIYFQDDPQTRATLIRFFESQR